jgi:cellulose synthase/poly-beta-1,6-N-acetylglucosamine synthase-like glycosyltransferase
VTLFRAFWWLAAAAIGIYHLKAWRAERARARACARQASAERPSLRERPRVSILVAAWNERGNIAAHVRSALGLAYPDLEYVLCAGGADGTYRAASTAMDGHGLLLQQKPGEGKQRALRRCLEQATGEVVYLTDADCLLDDLSFERTLQPILRRSAGAATGRSRPIAEQIARHPEVLCQWAPAYYAESKLGDTSPGLLGRNCAIRRDVLERTGGFAEPVATGTDYHLARQLARLGVPIAFARSSFVATEMPTRLSEYVRQQSRWLRNHWIHGARTGDTPAQIHAAQTWGIGVATVALPVLRPLLGAWCWRLWLLLALHGFGARLRYVGFLATAERLSVPTRVVPLSAAWFLLDAFAWARSLFDFLNARRRAIW